MHFKDIQVCSSLMVFKVYCLTVLLHCLKALLTVPCKGRLKIIQWDLTRRMETNPSEKDASGRADLTRSRSPLRPAYVCWTICLRRCLDPSNHTSTPCGWR
jgi:hypothetical protein